MSGYSSEKWQTPGSFWTSPFQGDKEVLAEHSEEKSKHCRNEAGRNRQRKSYKNRFYYYRRSIEAWRQEILKQKFPEFSLFPKHLQRIKTGNISRQAEQNQHDTKTRYKPVFTGFIILIFQVIISPCLMIRFSIEVL